MDDRLFTSSSDDSFDNLISASLPPMPPDEITKETNPFSKAASSVLWGIGLKVITFRFLYLDYILPLIGLFLMFTGFRALRRENRWFRYAYITVSAISVITLLKTVSDAFAVTELFIPSQLMYFTAIALSLMNLVTFIFMDLGIRSLMKKAELPVKCKGADGLVIWYGIIIISALAGAGGWIAFIILILCYILTIRSLINTFRAIGDAGYVISTDPPRVSNKAAAIAAASFIIIGILAGFTFGNRLPMDWTPVSPSEHESVSEIKSHLAELGFPEDLLNDLTAEDIKSCEGAKRLIVMEEDVLPLNEGRQVTEKIDDTYYGSTVYDKKELTFNGVGVELPGDRETWKLFHFFALDDDTDKFLSESVEINHAGRDFSGWKRNEGYSGRVLYNDGDTPMESPFCTFGYESYSSSGFFGERRNESLFAQFSFPKKGSDRRGYVSYDISELEDGFIVDSRISYTHQVKRLQYPAKTPETYAKTYNFLSQYRPFITQETAIHFFPRTDEVVPLK